MGELVEYDGDEGKTGATTRVYIARPDDDEHDAERIDSECQKRNDAGKYFDRRSMRSMLDRAVPSSSARSAAGRASRGAARPGCAGSEVKLRSDEHELSVPTNSPKNAEEVTKVRSGITLQSAVEKGAHGQWHEDVSWTMDVMTITSPELPMFWDDLSGELLDSTEVQKARKLEIEYFREMNVNDKVSCQEARDGGHQILGVRWVDVKKVPHRSRLVAKDIKTYSAPELFAATPPIESLKYLMRRAAQNRELSIMHIVVTRAYFYAEASRNIYVKLPHEDRLEGEENMCGKLRKAMYGTRDAAQNWERKCAEAVKAVGFEIGKVSPCHFYHPGRRTLGRLRVHRGQEVLTGHREAHGQAVRDQGGRHRAGGQRHASRLEPKHYMDARRRHVRE